MPRCPRSPLRSNQCSHRAYEWLLKRGASHRDVVVIGMSQDDPTITPSENYRYDLGVAFARQTGGLLGEIIRARGGNAATLPVLPTRSECDAHGFTMRDFEAQQIVAMRCARDIDHVGHAWQYLYRIWLPEGAFQPADLPAMELFTQVPGEIEWEIFDLEACIPVVPL